MSFIAFKMSTHQTNKDKLRAQKCRHFCFSFDLHNYCPTCSESGKGDDPCVIFEAPCDICASFTDDQMNKIQHRKRYIKKQKADASNAKDDELDLLGEGDRDSFTGSNADLESAADNHFTSPPHPQPLPFSSLALKTPAKTVIILRIRMLVHPRNLLRRSRINPKKHCHSLSRHELESRSASDQFNEESDESRIPSTKPKKH